MPISHHIRILSVATGLCALAFADGASAQSSGDFYKGRSVDMIIGASPGGGYDVYGRVVARHMPRHMAGNPTFVPKNMPGAGSSKAAEYIYSVAPKDGSAIGIIFPGSIMTPLLEEKRSTKYEPPKFSYLGTANKEVRVCAIRNAAPATTIANAMKTEIIMGATAEGGSTQDYPAVMNEILGTKFKIIRGYKGTLDITLAVERGEADGLCGWAWTSLKTQKANWLTDKSVNVAIQFGMENDPDLDKMGVPSIWSFVKNDSDKQLLELMIGQQVFGRPFVAPPGIPADRLKTLRAAFAATMKDKQFLADAEKSKLDIDYDSGEAVQKLVERMYATPKPVVNRLINAMK